MSDTAIYKPDVPPELEVAHRLGVAGGLCALILYGICACIFASCARKVGREVLLGKSRAILAKKLQLAYICLLFVFGSIFIACDTWVTVATLMDYPLYPGGGLVWALENYNHPIIVLANVSFVLTTWLADGFMMYRCTVLYNGILHVIVLPALGYLASIATGILLLFQTSQPNYSLFSKVNFGLAHFTVAAVLNALVTSVISARLIFHRMKMQEVMSLEQHSLRAYVSLTAILIESSALYAVFFLMFIIPFGLNHSAAKFFLPLLAQIQVISPLLVTYRLSREKGWTRDTRKGIVATLSQLEFKQDSTNLPPSTATVQNGQSTIEFAEVESTLATAGSASVKQGSLNHL